MVQHTQLTINERKMWRWRGRFLHKRQKKKDNEIILKTNVETAHGTATTKMITQPAIHDVETVHSRNARKASM